jgi:hypothetical protein
MITYLVVKQPFSKSSIFPHIPPATLCRDTDIEIRHGRWVVRHSLGHYETGLESQPSHAAATKSCSTAWIFRVQGVGKAMYDSIDQCSSV